jgi:hypothetical protein
LKAFLGILFQKQPERPLVGAAVLEPNVASQRVLEKCCFVRCSAKESAQSLKTSGEEELDDVDGSRRLDQKSLDELKEAVKSLGLMNAPLIQPVRTTSHRDLLFFRFSNIDKI